MANKTLTERNIINQRKAAASGHVLIPLIEAFLANECIPEDEEDFNFISMLLRARSQKREKGVFSPSMLGSCTRQAYFAKTQAERRQGFSATANSYFLEGNFKHFKWQFVMWKMHRAGIIQIPMIPDADGERLAVEVRVHSVAGDFAGTIDVIISVDGVYYLVDFKGVNIIDFQRFVRDGARPEYRVQIGGYAMIVNGTHLLDFVIKNCLLVEECKAGPISGGNSIALHEEVIPVNDVKDEVRDRLKELRTYVKEEVIPPPACVSTRHYQFQECPFNHFCLSEVRIIEKDRAKDKREEIKTMRVARSGRR